MVGVTVHAPLRGGVWEIGTFSGGGSSSFCSWHHIGTLNIGTRGEHPSRNEESTRVGTIGRNLR